MFGGYAHEPLHLCPRLVDSYRLEVSMASARTHTLLATTNDAQARCIVHGLLQLYASARPPFGYVRGGILTPYQVIQATIKIGHKSIAQSPAAIAARLGQIRPIFDNLPKFETTTSVTLRRP